MTDMVSAPAFALFAVLCVGGALGMLVSRNVVHAAFWLLEASVAAAGIFFLLGADYVGLVQLLVYSVAVAVLMLFTIMITLRRLEDAVRPRDFSPLAALVCVLFAGMMLFMLVRLPCGKSVGISYRAERLRHRCDRPPDVLGARLGLAVRDRFAAC